MKIKETKTADKSFVQQMREVREKVNLDIQDLTLEQLKMYIKKQKKLLPHRFVK